MFANSVDKKQYNRIGMKTIVALTGLTLIGIGAGTLIVGWKVGLSAGVIILGCGLLIDAVIK